MVLLSDVCGYALDLSLSVSMSLLLLNCVGSSVSGRITRTPFKSQLSWVPLNWVEIWAADFTTQYL